MTVKTTFPPNSSIERLFGWRKFGVSSFSRERACHDSGYDQWILPGRPARSGASASLPGESSSRFPTVSNFTQARQGIGMFPSPRARQGLICIEDGGRIRKGLMI